MCKFCDKIYTTYEIDNTSHWNLPYTLIYEDNKGFNLYTICDDDYYSCTAIWDIHYCPVCGKKLIPDNASPCIKCGPIVAASCCGCPEYYIWKQKHKDSD